MNRSEVSRKKNSIYPSYSFGLDCGSDSSGDGLCLKDFLPRVCKCLHMLFYFLFGNYMVPWLDASGFSYEFRQRGKREEKDMWADKWAPHTVQQITPNVWAKRLKINSSIRSQPRWSVLCKKLTKMWRISVTSNRVHVQCTYFYVENTKKVIYIILNENYDYMLTWYYSATKPFNLLSFALCFNLEVLPISKQLPNT